MLRLYRKTIFPRWHVNRKTSAGNKKQKHPKAVVLCASSQKQNHNQNDQKQQHADKQDKQFWDDPQFHFNFFRTNILETAGWLGTAAVYLSYHLKHINSIFEYDKRNSTCIFSNIVLAMPKCLTQEKKSITIASHSSSVSSNISDHGETTTNDADILGSFINLTEQYFSALQNVSGVRNINVNDKKAFRYFQSAARHGSSQGFYNLGLCYQLGKGTKVNLNMAAFCYRRAAIKGHGLASFNLAVFFYKGMGGLPVDPKIAKELLAEAAEKGVPEAQLYFGIEFLEEKRWQEAVRIFMSLSEKNISDAQYYLGLCYENGLGVEKDKNTAMELFSKSAAQGNKRAILKLQTCQKRNILGLTSIKLNAVKSEKSSDCLHVSASVPELSAIVKKSVQNTYFSISSYLDLNMLSFFALRNDNLKPKDNFFIDESKVKECSNTFLPFRNLALVMHVKS